MSSIAMWVLPSASTMTGLSYLNARLRKSYATHAKLPSRFTFTALLIVGVTFQARFNGLYTDKSRPEHRWSVRGCNGVSGNEFQEGTLFSARHAQSWDRIRAVYFLISWPSAESKLVCYRKAFGTLPIVDAVFTFYITLHDGHDTNGWAIKIVFGC
jgi:hypothetical protein